MSEETPSAQEAARLIRRIRENIAEMRAELGNMPIFVRPMIRRGFAKRTGKSYEEWETLAASLLARVTGPGELTRAAFRSVSPDLEARLDRLAYHYRTAPERASRFMRDQTALRLVAERSKERETAVLELLALVRKLPE